MRILYLKCIYIHLTCVCKQVVGSQARILYSDQEGRIAIALAFNKAVAEKYLQVSLCQVLDKSHTKIQNIMLLVNVLGNLFCVYSEGVHSRTVSTPFSINSELLCAYGII